MELLRSVVRAEGMTAIISTHDPSIQAKADSTLTLADGKLNSTPRHLAVADPLHAG